MASRTRAGSCACCEERTHGNSAMIGVEVRATGNSIVVNRNLSLYNLFVVIGFYRRNCPSRLFACPFRHAYACHLPPGGRQGWQMSLRLYSYCRQFCFHTSRPLPALAILAAPNTSSPAPSVTLRVPPPSRREAGMVRLCFYRRDATKG